MSGRLGKLEALVLLVVDILGRNESYFIVPRARLTTAVAECLARKGELHGSFESFKASVSRAVLNLCEKGLLVGYYRAWYEYRGVHGSADVFVGFGEKPVAGLPSKDRRRAKRGFSRPRLTFVRLSEKGQEALLTSQEVNEWSERLGWREVTQANG